MLTVYPSRYAIMANFKRGRDKKKRKSRMLRNAAIAAGGLAGLAGAGYGAYRLAKAGKLGAGAQGMAERAGLRANSIKARVQGMREGIRYGDRSVIPQSTPIDYTPKAQRVGKRLQSERWNPVDPFAKKTNNMAGARVVNESGRRTRRRPSAG